MPRPRVALLTTVALLSCSTAAFAQASLQSGIAQVTLNAVRQPSLTLAITSEPTLSIPDLKPGLNEFAAPVSVRSEWELAEPAVVTLVGYFDEPEAAMVGPAATIAASAVEASLDGGAFAAFSGRAVEGAGTQGGSLALFTEVDVSASGGRSDEMRLRLNVTDPLLPVGVYRGTLNLRLVVQ